VKFNECYHFLINHQKSKETNAKTNPKYEKSEEHRKERELSTPSYLPQKEFFQEKA